MRSIISGIISSGIFLLLYLILGWSVLVSVLISACLYVGLFLISKPKLKIGKVQLSDIDNGEEVKLIYDESIKKMESIEDSIKLIKNQDIYGKSREISIIGRDIMNFLRKNPQKISSSIYFLDYYLNTTRKILNNFIDFEVGNVSDEMYSQITNKTIESLDLLKIVYKNQRDSYYSDKLMEIDVENDVLEATIKLGGGKY